MTGELTDALGSAGAVSQPARPLRAASERVRAALIVIGDEVLSGRFVDRNTPVIVQAMARHGLALGEVAILPDEVDRVAEVLRSFVARFDMIVTTGGIGPTHDDRTWEAIGAALGEEISLRLDVLAQIEAHVGSALTEEQQRMARMPASAVLERVGESLVAHAGSIWVLPGVPWMVAQRIDGICARYAAMRPWVCTLDLEIDEWAMVPQIDAVVGQSPEVSIGSYPILDPSSDHRLRLTFTATERREADAAVRALIQSVGEAHVVRSVWTGPDEGASSLSNS